MSQMAPNGARRIFVPTNPDLVGILGRTDLDFENFHFWVFLDPRFPDFQIPLGWASRHLAFGPAGIWALWAPQSFVFGPARACWRCGSGRGRAGQSSI